MYAHGLRRNILPYMNDLLLGFHILVYLPSLFRICFGVRVVPGSYCRYPEYTKALSDYILLSTSNCGPLHSMEQSNFYNLLEIYFPSDCTYNNYLIILTTVLSCVLPFPLFYYIRDKNFYCVPSKVSPKKYCHVGLKAVSSLQE